MIGFIVPIKPKKASKNWEFDNVLFERTIKSICAQTYIQFKVIVVYNDKPTSTFNHGNIVYVSIPLPEVKSNQIEDLDYVLKYYDINYAEKMFDKGRKITYGANVAINLGCDYIMAIDSDDLISNKIAEFIETHKASNPPGWVIKKGFIYNEGSNYLIKKHDIQNVNGSTHIIRKDLIEISDFNKNIFWNYNLFEAHGYTYFRIRDFHKEFLLDCPFFGIVYIISGNNYSNISRIMNTAGLKKIIRFIFRASFLTQKIKKEFGLYELKF